MQKIMDLQNSWANDSRWSNIKREYSAQDVLKLAGSFKIEHTLADRGAKKLWNLLQQPEAVRALGALTGNQAMQQVKAEAIQPQNISVKSEPDILISSIQWLQKANRLLSQ